jgi:hypothetical protein
MATVSSLEKDFKKLVKADALAQAYVLHGQDVKAQFEIAQALANFLEVGKWQQPEGVLIDARFIDGATQNLGVDVAREFSDFLYRQPVASMRRTLVVSNATEFTDQAQNAILKIVEEPPAHGLIILAIRDVNSLLPALKSRLQRIYVTGQGPAVLSATEQRAEELVQQFLKTSGSERSKFVKALIDEDKEVEKSEQIVEAFVRALILKLGEKPQEHAVVLRELLKRQTAMGDYNTSKKLQIDAALQYLR